MNFELGKTYIVEVKEDGIIPLEEFDESRWFDKDHDDLDFLTDAEKAIVIKAVLKDIRAEMNAKMEEADRNCKNSDSLSVRSWCRERAQAFDDAMKIIDRKIAEVEANYEV